MTNYSFIFWASALTLALATACSSESMIGEDSGRGRPAQIAGSIGTAPVAETKAATGNGDDISYESFADGDAIGFFSVTGLTAANEKLTYSGGSFKSPDGDDALIWKEGLAQRVYAYYPYSAVSADAEDAYAVSIWRPAQTGAWKDGFEDLLAASANNLANGSLISLAFSHQFAMLILQRGEGFEQNSSEVAVQLSSPVGKKALISRKEWNTSLRLQVDETGDGVSELLANAGTYKPAGSSAQGQPCYYVLIPVGELYKDGVKQGGAAGVTSVRLENNAGRELTVPFALSSGTFKANTKYLVTVNMRDNQAVIEPEEIRRWEEVTIPVEIPAGIGSAADFEIWMSAYNTASPDRMAILSRYGTYDSGKWTFRLLNDISCNFTLNPSCVITSFQEGDIFDGQGHTISGLSLAGNPSAGFFGTLWGEVRNLTLENIQVEKSVPDAGSFGTLAARMAGSGRITRCRVTGDASLVVGVGYVGGLVGDLESGGSLTDCTSTAAVAGTDATTTGLLVGRNSGGTLSGCMSTGTLITNN